jgi:tetratricopeptide (TPR) repeat protein
MRRASAACAVAVLLFGAHRPSVAWAQKAVAAEDRAAAETLFYAGRGLMEDGRHAEACRKFEESYRLEPAPGTLLNLALCHEKEGRVASAWAEYRTAVLEARRMNRPDREQVASERVAALEPLLPKLVVEVPEEARIERLSVIRNGVRLAEGAWGEALPVDPGVVEVRAEAPGFIAWTGSVEIKLSEASRIAIPRLEPQPVVVTPEPIRQQEAPSWSTRKTLAVATGGAGLAALATGAYFGVLALEGKRASDAACPAVNGELRCSDAGASAMDEANSRAWVANIGIGVGVAAIAAAAYLFLSDRRESAVTGNGTSANRHHSRVPTRDVAVYPGSLRVRF